MGDSLDESNTNRCKDLLVQAYSLQIEELQQRVIQAEEMAKALDLPIEEIAPIFREHLKDRTALKVVHLQQVLESTLEALQSLPDNSKTNSVNMIVDALKVAVGASTVDNAKES